MKNKILHPSQLALVIKQLKTKKKKIVFTNGTFDILHLGHVQYLQKARNCGDVLIVGVNTDRSVKTYKSPNRPVNPENDRIQVLTALQCVDYAILFDEPTPLNLILKIRPDILAKGADWKKSQIAGAKEVESWGGEVKLIKLVPGKSTTHIINTIHSSKPAV